jgi:hypothetical protein
MASLLLATGLMEGSASPPTKRSQAYLPALGPAPVRFQPHSQALPVLPWRPLLQAEKQPPDSVAPVPNTPSIEQSVTEPLTNVIAPLTITADSPAAPSPAPTVAIPFLSPPLSYLEPASNSPVDLQELLGYLLSPSTNEPGAKVIMPVFVPPPAPMSFPSSHATYESR